ncbi:MAG: nitrate reductase cytochrome c-type subunit, partial [Desulfobulbia bacterium]
MRHAKRRGLPEARTVILGLIIFLGAAGTDALAEDNVPMNYDNQGKKIYSSQQEIPEVNLMASSTGRNLTSYYMLRQYPGSPPKIPHEVDLTFSGNETDCLSCHGKGGYSPEYGKFVPITPHPENILCYQCHAQVATEEKFVESDWQSIRPPRLGRSFLSSSPPPVPHSLQLRENCIACHTGPGAVAEIRVEHSARGNCRQCHVPAVQTA